MHSIKCCECIVQRMRVILYSGERERESRAILWMIDSNVMVENWLEFIDDENTHTHKYVCMSLCVCVCIYTYIILVTNMQSSIPSLSQFFFFVFHGLSQYRSPI